VVLVIEESTIKEEEKEVLNIERTYVFVKNKEAKSLSFQIIKGPFYVRGFLLSNLLIPKLSQIISIHEK